MKFIIKTVSVLLFVSALFISQAVYAQSSVSLTDADKAQIIEIILRRMLSIPEAERLQMVLTPPKEPAPLCENPETEKIAYISAENISESLLPKIPCLKFVLLRPDEIKEKGKEGIYYLRLDKLEVLGQKVEARLSYSHMKGSYLFKSGIIYEYQKRSGRWEGARTGGYGSMEK